MLYRIARLRAALAVGLLLLSQTLPGGQASAAGCPCHLYLPLVQPAPPFPRLVAPADGAALGSLAPLLSWTPQISGTYEIQAATDPAFSTLAISATADLRDTQLAQHIPDGNLAELTRYYWRVGVVYHAGLLFAQPWSFTTPAKNNALLPPRPQLLTPPNGGALPATNVTLTWQAVPNAWYYRVKIYDASSRLFDAQILSGTSYHVGGLTPGATYTWEVKALNQYGWGTYPPPWSFHAA